MTKYTLITLALIALLAYPADTAQGQQEPDVSADKPNVVVVYTDDMRQDDLDQLAGLRAQTEGRGITFNNSYVTTSLCCPSRASYLTGQYATNHGVETNNGFDGGHEAYVRNENDDSNIYTWMNDAGYSTGFFGKYLNFYPGGFVPPGFDEWYAWNSAPTSQSATKSDGSVETYDNIPLDSKIVTNKTTQFIRGTPDAEPFFTTAAYYGPHVDARVAKQDRGKFDETPLSREKNYNERDITDKPEDLQHLQRLTPRQRQNTVETHRTRLERLAGVERGVEDIYDTLEAEGELDNTYVIFTSDNGFQLGEHRMPHGKTTHYEESARVPLTISGPGIEPGQKINHTAINNDLAPTIAELGGAQSPAVDGTSFARLLDPKTRPAPGRWRQSLGSFNWQHNDYMDWRPTKAVIGRTQVYARMEGGGPVAGRREFYKLNQDPFQIESDYRGMPTWQVRNYNNRLRDIIRCDGSTECREAEGFSERLFR